jgi:hypothetical protein
MPMENQTVSVRRMLRRNWIHWIKSPGGTRVSNSRVGDYFNLLAPEFV